MYISLHVFCRIRKKQTLHQTLNSFITYVIKGYTRTVVQYVIGKRNLNQKHINVF